MSAEDRLVGIAFAHVIRAVIKDRIEQRVWRSVAEEHALCHLLTSEKRRRRDVVAYVREQYDAAGAGYSGLWQS